MNSWALLLGRLVGVSPNLLAYLIGIGLCLRHAEDQRRRAIAVGVAMAIMLTNLLVSLFLGSWLFTMLRNWLDAIELASLASTLIYALPSSVAMLLLLWAVFYGAEHVDSDEFEDDAPNS